MQSFGLADCTLPAEADMPETNVLTKPPQQLSEAQSAAAHQAAQAGARAASTECAKDGGIRAAGRFAATQG